MAFARLTGGRTTKRGNFGYTKHDGPPVVPSPLLQERGQAGRAEIENRLHILATATSKAASLWWTGEQRLISPPTWLFPLCGGLRKVCKTSG
jgi:hypothetical protein